MAENTDHAALGCSQSSPMHKHLSLLWLTAAAAYKPLTITTSSYVSVFFCGLFPSSCCLSLTLQENAQQLTHNSAQLFYYLHIKPTALSDPQ